MQLRTSLAVILNPTAGQGRKADLLERTIRVLRQTAAVDIYETQRPGEGGDATKAALKSNVELIIAAGGDGTINEVVNGLDGSEIPLGVIPIGTTNVLAAELRVPRTPESLAISFLHGASRQVSVGRANGRRFTMMASAGFDADIIQNTSPVLKRAIGKGAYICAFASELFRYTPRRLTVRLDGKHISASQVLIAKGGRYAGNFIAVPHVSLDQPVFCVYVADLSSRREICRMVTALLRGRLSAYPGIKTFLANEVLLDGGDDAPIQADGEIIGVLPMRLTIDHARLRVVDYVS